MNLIQYLAGVCFSLVSMHSFGQPLPLVWCDGCSAAQQAARAGAQETLGTVYVANTNAGTIQAFNVYRDVDDTKSPPTRTTIASPVAGASHYLQVGQAMIDFYRRAPVGWHKSVTLKLDGSLSSAPRAKSPLVPYRDSDANVYKVINPGPNQVKLTNWTSGLVSTTFSEAGSFLSSIGSAFKLVDISHAPKVTVEIEFNDGSRINLNEDFTTTNAKMTVDEASGIDSHFNHVPATRKAATCSTGGDRGICEYDFTGTGNSTDYQNWKKQMALLGVNVGAGPSGGGRWACVVVGEGDDETFSCTHQ